MSLPKVEIYTDGACSGNPGPGGWGVYMLSGAHRKELYGGDKETTNNRMEMMAVIQGLNALKKRSHVTLYTDSKYVMHGITEWMEGWKARNWRTAAKKPVKNQDLWQEIDKAIQKHDIKFIWVKGHDGNEGNEKADELARKGIPAF
ncbi:MAG: ribonuclease HI [Alphaproteobacteria bacterium]|nr:ribonuclease HI [Alphaproteobacteria bacterium]